MQFRRSLLIKYTIQLIFYFYLYEFRQKFLHFVVTRVDSVLLGDV